MHYLFRPVGLQGLSTWNVISGINTVYSDVPQEHIRTQACETLTAFKDSY